jgi:nitrous oxide reductase accessory protein NosL
MGIKPQVVIGLLVVTLVASSFSFAVSVSGSEPDPVPFEATTEGGLSADARLLANKSSAVLPRAQAFYTQYQYPVGYVGIPFLLNDLHRSARTAEFGQLTTVYVTDFSGTGVYLNKNNTLAASEEGTTDWVTAKDAYFVVESDTQTIGRTPAIVPFSQASDANSFTEQYGGVVEQWDELRQRRYENIARSQNDWERLVSERQAWAENTTGAARVLVDRPVSTVVGRDTQTLQAAIKQAPANTTVRIPPGRYDVDGVRISKPITISGAGSSETVISGDETGSVFNVTSRQVAILNLNITGVGREMDIGPVFVGNQYPKQKMHNAHP